MRVLLAAIAGLALGFVLSEALPRTPMPRASAPAASCPEVPVTRADLDRVRRDVVAAVQTRAPAPAETPPVPPGPSPEAIAAAQRALALVDHAVQAGVWSADDVAEARELMPLLGDEDRRQVMSLLTIAVNEQRLRPTSPILF